MTHDEIQTLRPDALSPAKTAEAAVSIGEAKAAMPAARRFASSMLAGAFIAFGALYFCVFLGDPTMPFAVQRVGGGLCFCLGLALVLCCGAELFTGNILMVCAKASGRIGWRSVLGNWAAVWVGNLAGALAVLALVCLADVAAMNGGAVGEAFVSVAAGKVAPDWTTLFFKGVLCNVLVCLAVWIGFSARTVADKVVGILLPISAFVACGFEHCVANMFFLPMGLLLNAAGVGAVDAVTLGNVACNLSAATLGNVAGGMLVGLAFWFVHRPNGERR